ERRRTHLLAGRTEAGPAARVRAPREPARLRAARKPGFRARMLLHLRSTGAPADAGPPTDPPAGRAGAPGAGDPQGARAHGIRAGAARRPRGPRRRHPEADPQPRRADPTP